LRASVIIPTFNRRALLLQTLASLERQTVPPDRYEVIVGIDGSTDGTQEALAALRPSYSLRWVWQQNQGAAAASNAAARLGRHEVLVFLDDDQVASAELLAAHLEGHQRYGVVFIQGLYPLAPGYDRRGASLMYERSLYRALAPLDSAHPTTAQIWSANVSCRRGTWAEVHGFDETFREYGGEDTDFGLRVAALGVPFVFEPRALSHHMHTVSYAAHRRQAFSEGTAMVRLAQRHALPVGSLSGGGLDRLVDRAFRLAWHWNRPVMELAGRLLTAGLWGADLVRFPPVQLAAARLIHRFYKVGGITVESLRQRASSVVPMPTADSRE
jgi:GT2 family glycosyltransferase